HGRSGLAVWIPVADEAGVVSAMLDRGWAVAPGERFRIASPPAIRIGTGTLSADDAQRLAADLAGCLRRASPRSD
ncbi:MAG: GntR family transcriptional regulator, partial [Streptosporangiaceae bacterium]